MQADNRGQGCLIVVSGPSGAGKGTLLGMAMEGDENAVFSISATTRKARGAEVEGKDYFFVDDNRFNNMVENGEFLEYASVFGAHSYGTPKAPVIESMAKGYDVYLDIDVQGALQVKKAMPEAVLVFILPPSKAILEQRLRSRATDTDEAIARRLQTAQTELGYANEYDYIIINNDAQKAAKEIKAVVSAEKCTAQRMAAFVQNWR